MAGLPHLALKFRKLARVLLLAPRSTAQALITAYRLTLSPLVGLECRHLPTCSVYAAEAIGRFGVWAGCWMALARLCRCHPLGTSGLDFVPRALPLRSRWYFPWRYGRWRGTHSALDAEPSETVSLERR
jgi:putative membrane protein insertion efficiency factor